VADDAIPQARWTKKQLKRWELWLLLVAPFVLIWALVLLTDPTLGNIAIVTIATLLAAPLRWYWTRLGIHRGQLW
jgi:hypothetical protein